MPHGVLISDRASRARLLFGARFREAGRSVLSVAAHYALSSLSWFSPPVAAVAQVNQGMAIGTSLYDAEGAKIVPEIMVRR